MRFQAFQYSVVHTYYKPTHIIVSSSHMLIAGEKRSVDNERLHLSGLL